jgi:lipopolysaccharide/colanic/teichoic acid biosynthesis glycosyltransferase
MPSESQFRPKLAHSGRLPRLYLLAICDFLVSVACYVVAASVLEGEFDLCWLSVNENAWSFLVLVILAMQASLLLQGLYWQPQPQPRIAFLLSLVQSQGVALLMAAVLSYLTPGWRLPLGVMALGVALSFVALFGWRLLFTAVFWDMPEFFRILFVGTGAVAKELAAYLTAHPELKLAVLGFLEEAGFAWPRGHPGIPPEKLLGPPASLSEQVAQLRPDTVVIGMEDSSGRLPVRSLLALRSAGVKVEEVSQLYETVFRRVCAAELRPRDLLFRRDFGARPGGAALQSVYVNLGALLGVVLLSPLILLIAIAVKLTSRGPVFEGSACFGFEGLPFSRLTFRCVETGGRLAEPRQGLERRATRLGGWLKRLHLHKLPELFNVLRGEMSLIGPRPHRVEFAEALAGLCPYYSQRHSVKPGITGWAQINLKRQPEIVDEVTALEYDLYYIKHLSPALDAYILLHSVF